MNKSNRKYNTKYNTKELIKSKKKKSSFKKKKKEDLTRDEKDIINTISILQDEHLPVGSFLFKEHFFPGDIDMCETILECCSENEAKRKISTRILTSIKRIFLHEPKVYLADFKAGEDGRFDFKLNTDYSNLKKFLINFNKLKDLFSKDELSKINILTEGLYQNKSDELSSKIINEIIYNKKILRWDITELLNQKKKQNNKIFKFEDCISDGSIVKMDVWYWTNHKYLEITNFLNICLSDEYETTCKKYISKPTDDLKITLIHDIISYYEKKNYLKAIKRIWSLLNHIIVTNKKLATKINAYGLKIQLTPIFKEIPAQLSQIYAELEVIELMSTKFQKKSKSLLFPANNILFELLGIENRIKKFINSKIIASSININDNHDYIDKLFKNINSIKNNPKTINSNSYWSNKNIMRFLNLLSEDIPKIMNFVSIYTIFFTEIWLESENIDLNKIISFLKKL